MIFKDHPDLVKAAAEANKVDVDLVWKILELEPSAKNLHAYGNRPVFRRKLAVVVDTANPARVQSASG